MDCLNLSSSFATAPWRPTSTRVRLCRRRYLSTSLVASGSSEQWGGEEGEGERRRRDESLMRLLLVSATVTVVSTSLPQPPAQAKVSERKRAGKRAEKKAEAALSPAELKAWSRALPIVSDRIPYTEVLNLKEEGKLKHIVKLPGTSLRQRPDVVLVVLEDSRVLRTALPTSERDEKFWDDWDRLQLSSVCINAYTPPIKKPEVPSPYLGFLSRLTLLFARFRKTKPQSKRVLEIEKARRELAARRKAELAKVRDEREAMEKSLRTQKKIEDRKRRLEERKAKFEQSLVRARKDYEYMGLVWANMARDRNIATVFALGFFPLFYYFVVYGYRKQQKDFEDRRKIEQAEAEERKKMRELEREMAGLESAGDDEVEDEGDQQNPYLKMASKFMQSGARVRRAHGKRLPQYMERGIDVKFTDVAGLGKIRLELEEIVKFFTLGEMYRRRGVKIPGGILLCGPPGVGKTLLAKAVAGEAGVNFFSISASQFVEIYVGVGASRVRALYQEAKENAPSVVFIDELDAVGRERGLIKGSGGQERDATLNQLLVCLDGFEGRGNVITIAATNRPDILDPALVRPGRFDRKIFIPKPGLIGRKEILEVHARKKPMASDVDYVAVASMTEGMVGAELANIVEVAAINMIRESRTEMYSCLNKQSIDPSGSVSIREILYDELVKLIPAEEIPMKSPSLGVTQITTDDLLQAAQIEERGMLDKKERSLDMWKHLALNEAAMAVVAANFPDLNNIEFVTIAPRAGRELGYVRVKMDHMKFSEGMLSRQSLLDHITVQIAPRAAEEMWYGQEQLSTIWAETADNARSAARSFVLGGLSEKHYGLSDHWVADRINDIDTEALHVLNSCYQRSKEILERNRKLMDAVVDQLVQKKSLTKREFFNLVGDYGNLEPLPPSIVDIRNAKYAQFQELMMTKKEPTQGGSL